MGWIGCDEPFVAKDHALVVLHADEVIPLNGINPLAIAEFALTLANGTAGGCGPVVVHY